MLGENHIQDIPLPITLDFNSLKKEGLKIIQEGSSSEWTNLNPSDPGITILDQLCFALTELGYCMEFSMPDMLTDASGKLVLENQFFTPEKILTTAPVTIKDYIKFIINAVGNVKNAVIVPLENKPRFVGGGYQVYIQPDFHYDAKSTKEIKSTDKQKFNSFQEDVLCNSVFIALNTSRNLGEYFLVPKLLKDVDYTLHYTLTLKAGFELKNVLVAMQTTVEEYIFPTPIQTGYKKLQMEGEDSDEIFNGPELSNGWMMHTSATSKKNSIYNFEIAKVLEEVEGVSSITNVYFVGKNNRAVVKIQCSEEELIRLDVTSIAKNTKNDKGNSKVTQQKFENYFTSNLKTIPFVISPEHEIETVQLGPELPKGNFRDINSYYSIQNTFPDAYKVGSNALKSNASEFQIAQSRQLKGYLTLFDQVLANQFSQLANFKNLFSFKNMITGTPSDREHYFEAKDRYEQLHQKYPVPYKSFSPTYFYQSLYHSVPNIKPLLENNKVFDYSYEVVTERELQHEAWLNYQGDPYNSYIRGLEDIIENEEVNIERRNQMLNHLLARHGEAPEYLEAIIAKPSYTGDLIKDRVIVKSIYLQNFQQLSYYRAKGYNYLGADKLYLNCKTKSVLKLESVPESILDTYKQGNQSDFIVRMEKIEKEQKLTFSDSINYATVDLKLNMLFTLNRYYQNYLVESAEGGKANSLDQSSKLKTEIIYWLLTCRKGFLSMETSLLCSGMDCSELSERYKSLSENKVLYFFPKFVPQLMTTDFQERLNLFFYHEYPITVSVNTFFIETTDLMDLIRNYSAWHNQLRANSTSIKDYLLWQYQLFCKTLKKDQIDLPTSIKEAFLKLINSVGNFIDNLEDESIGDIRDVLNKIIIDIVNLLKILDEKVVTVLKNSILYELQKLEKHELREKKDFIKNFMQSSDNATIEKFEDLISNTLKEPILEYVYQLKFWCSKQLIVEKSTDLAKVLERIINKKAHGIE